MYKTEEFQGPSRQINRKAMKYLNKHKAFGARYHSGRNLESSKRRGDESDLRHLQRPTEWYPSTYITLYKRGSSENYENYRTIWLIFHGNKVLLKIIYDRLYSTSHSQISPEQTGFTKSKSPREKYVDMKALKWLTVSHT